VVEQRTQLLTKDAYVRDLEDYIDDLLVKVMETHPKILQNPYVHPPNNVVNNTLSTGSSTAVHGLPASATLPPGVYVTNQLNKPAADFGTVMSQNPKIKSKKGKGNRIELPRIFSRLS